MGLNTTKLQKPLRQLRKILDKFPPSPSPELVHDLRTRTRRVEAEFEALKLDSRRNEQKLLKSLKPIRRKAGNVRDVDVLTGYATKLGPDGDEQCVIKLLENLGAERYAQADKLRRIVRRDGSAAISRLKRSAKYIEKVCDKSNKDAGKDGVWPVEAMSLGLQLANELRRWPRLNAGNLHRFRLKVKKLRYTLELAENPKADFVEALGDSKDAIGEWHDWEELGRIAAKVLDHGPSCELMSVIHSNVKEKLEEALSVANRMRQKYLKQPARARRRGSKRPLALVPKAPVIEAASTLAA